MTRTVGWLWLLALAVLVDSTWAQAPGGRLPPGRRPPGVVGRGPGGATTTDGEGEVKLPDDPRLLTLHKNFVDAAMTLAAEYERTQQGDKARTCYAEILRLVPGYTPAQEKLDKLHEKEATAERKLFVVKAGDGWQDTGITLVQGKPVVLKAEGTWRFMMSYQLDADGIPIPEELRDFNLGALIAAIRPLDASAADKPDKDKEKEQRPFVVGKQKEIVAPYSGRLFLRMYDADNSDNTGTISVTITGTFQK